MPIDPPKALLFDLGGVLVDIDFARALDAWAPHSALSLAQMREAFKHDLPYEQHERGEIDSGGYFAHLATTLRLTASHEEIERGWNAIFIGEIAEARALVQQARKLVPCYAFTNTNASHMTAWAKLFPGVSGAFDRVFASHEMGLRKPEALAFERICQEIGTNAGSILFFDDTLGNVRAAHECGLQAVHVRSPQDIADSLRASGFAA